MKYYYTFYFYKNLINLWIDFFSLEPGVERYDLELLSFNPNSINVIQSWLILYTKLFNAQLN